ncbi:hypothetical protein SDC9_61137 [bioreactor metagenome]|uniref:Uncharacterized protein n=1 Tax=bioreactor metagenome TaxID=1076179 RepID=A0A644XKL8_9ZZZZ
MFAQMRIDVVCHQLLAEVAVGGDILHRQRRHGFVIAKDLRNVVGRQLALQYQNLSLDLVAVDVQRTSRRSKQLVRLLDDD